MGDQGAADLVTQRLQRLRQAAHALAGPPQRRFRIPARLDVNVRVLLKHLTARRGEEPGWEKLTWRDRSQTARAKFAVDSLAGGEWIRTSSTRKR